MNTQTTTPKGDALRAQARESAQRSRDSFERCDTDGFLSQWASDVSSQRLNLEADLADDGDMAEFPALFSAATGELVPAKLISTKYGTAWALLDPANPRGRFLGFFNESRARKPATRSANNRKKGYTVGTIRAAARVVISGGGTGLAGAMSCRPVVRRVDTDDFTNVTVIEPETLGGEW